ncbi:MAG: hypothetical protein M1828_000352 [Chrysothrix sp. TS-e1954]|nr:MAG: hypothetical protein M1828_000352 [Chrysothrix sp. TS-e1954]
MAGLNIEPQSHSSKPGNILPRRRPSLSLETPNTQADRRILHAFLDIYFPKDVVARHDPNHIWLQQAAFLANPGSALRLSLRAISMVRVGFNRHDHTLIAQGRETYVCALRELQNALGHDVKMKEDRTLAACRVLTMYELFDSTSFRAWNKHQSGMSHLLENIGPAAFTSPLGRSVIESFRGPAASFQMFQSIQQRQRSFLTSPEWRDQMKKCQDPQQRLHDVGLQLAGFLEDFDQASDSGAIWQDSQTLYQYLSRCAEFDSTLEKFYATLLRDAAGMPLYWDGNEGSSPVPEHESLEFPNLTTAQTLMIHWALQLIINMTVANICKHAQASNVMSTPSPTTSIANTYMWTGNTTLIKQMAHGHDTNRLRQTAILITRSMAYCMRDEQGLVGPQRCIFPIRVALTAFRTLRAHELPWCEEVYAQLAHGKSLGYAKDIVDFEGRWAAIEASSISSSPC